MVIGADLEEDGDEEVHEHVVADEHDEDEEGRVRGRHLRDGRVLIF